MSDTQAILADLARAKAIFQLRAIAVHIGFPHPSAPVSPFGAAHGRPDAVTSLCSVGACPLPEPIGQPFHVERRQKTAGVCQSVLLRGVLPAWMVDQHGNIDHLFSERNHG